MWWFISYVIVFVAGATITYWWPPIRAYLTDTAWPWLRSKLPVLPTWMGGS